MLWGMRPYLSLLYAYPLPVHVLSGSSGVSCDACGKGGFSGKRYKCLQCYDFDLCSDCYEAGETGSGRHNTMHPMQCILTRVDAGEGSGWSSVTISTLGYIHHCLYKIVTVS